MTSPAPASTAAAPLVTVVVRTLWRPTLPRSLACVAAQGHRPVELVVVDAAGTGELPPVLPGVSIRVVRGGRLDRPRAANAGLAAARGEWIGFLDEDDEIAPDHVASLLAAAGAAGLPVAYSQTRVIGAEGGERILGGPFDAARLRQSNYIAVHAALFHRSLVDRGARFDPALPRFEDWDFWLQLARVTPFAFSGRATALYHASAGQSGVGTDANLDREAALAARAAIARKWP